MSSSPQLTGMTFANPARRHACASCTGDAGNAASTASVPRMTIGTAACTVGSETRTGDDNRKLRKPRAGTVSTSRSDQRAKAVHKLSSTTENEKRDVLVAAQTLQTSSREAGCEDAGG